MESCNDLFVVIVDEKNKANDSETKIVIKQEDMLIDSTTSAIAVEDIIESVEKHGELIDFDIVQVKEGPPGEDYQYLKAKTLEEYDDYVQDKDDEDENEVDEGEADVVVKDQHCTSGRRFCYGLKPWQKKSFVKELKQQCPELKKDEELLVKTVAEAMKSVKRPPPPKDYFLITGAMFECVICGALTGTNPAAWQHYQEKHGTRYLICYACGASFKSTTTLYKHEKRCNAPDAVVVLKARAHILGAKARNRPFVDPKNKVKRKQKSYYKKGLQFKCSFCPATFASKNNVKEHELNHKGLRPYKCTQCPAAYTSNMKLVRHQAKHTGVEYICHHCNRSFYLKTYLVAHMDTHKPLKKHPCELCDRRFAQKVALQRHVNRIHFKLPLECACEMCPKRFPQLYPLKVHMQQEHGISIKTRKGQLVGRTNVGFSCVLCKESFKTKDELDKHNMENHPSQKKHPCEYCGRHYSWKQGLKRHIEKEHSNLPPPRACPMCSSRFSRMYLLKRHMLKEHGMKIMTRNTFFRSLPNLSDKQIEEARGIRNPKDSNPQTVIKTKEHD